MFALFPRFVFVFWQRRVLGLVFWRHSTALIFLSCAWGNWLGSWFDSTHIYSYSNLSKLTLGTYELILFFQVTVQHIFVADAWAMAVGQSAIGQGLHKGEQRVLVASDIKREARSRNKYPLLAVSA